MEKAILKTLIYSDQFDYPLKAWEIHRWLIKEKCPLGGLEENLKKLISQKKIETKSGFYFLKGRQSIVAGRKRKVGTSEQLVKKAVFVSKLFKLIPWIQLVGVCGGLALNNVTKRDNINLIIITSKNRLWLTRLLCLSFLEILGLRKKANDLKTATAGKISLNMVLSADHMQLPEKDIFTAHETLQTKVIWQKGRTYEKFLQSNLWALEFFPNWISNVKNEPVDKLMQKVVSKVDNFWGVFDKLEAYARDLQKRVSLKLSDLKPGSDCALFLYSNERRVLFLKSYRSRLKRARLSD